MKAKAAVLYEYNTPLVVEEVEVDGPRKGEVLVKLAASGVCYSNYHTIKGHTASYQCPIVLGDEGAGTVVEVGPGVTTVKPGDPLILSWVPYCSNCYYCNRGLLNLCEKASSRSPFLKDGQRLNNYSHVSSFAEYTVVPEAGVIPISSDVPLDKAALIGCAVPTGWGAVVNTAAVEPGASVAVIGLGGIGLSAVMGAVAVNAGKIIGVDIKDSKLEMSKGFGVTHTINSTQGNLVQQLKDLTEGRGVDYAFDTIGLPEVTANAFAAIRPGGTVVTVGINADWAEVTLSFPLIYGERKLLGCAYGSIQPPVDIPRLVDQYMTGKLDLDRLVTKRFPIEEINEAFDTLLTGEVARSIIQY